MSVKKLIKYYTRYWRCARPLGALREIRSRGLEEGKSAAEPMLQPRESAVLLILQVNEIIVDHCGYTVDV